MTLKRLPAVVAAAILLGGAAAFGQPDRAEAENYVAGARFLLAHGTQKTVPQNTSLLITRIIAQNADSCAFNVTGPSGASLSYPAGTDPRGLVLTALETVSNTGTADCYFSAILFFGQAPSAITNFLQPGN